MIKEIFKGESCTLMFTFPEAYDMGRISSHKVYIGIQNYVGVVDGQSIVLKLKSSDTDKLCGVQKVVLWFNDSTLGLRKPYCGDLVITKTKAEADNESESDIYDIIIPIIISENSVTVGDILYNYVKGENGSNGRGISNLELISTVGLVKTYRITYTDNTTFEYSVSDGESPELTEQSIVDALGFTPEDAANKYISFDNKSGSFTLELSQINKVIRVNSSIDIAVYVPENISVAFQIGTVIEVWQDGIGKAIIMPDNHNVSVKAYGATEPLVPCTNGTYTAVKLLKSAENEWLVSGSYSTVDGTDYDPLNMAINEWQAVVDPVNIAGLPSANWVNSSAGGNAVTIINPRFGCRQTTTLTHIKVRVFSFNSANAWKLKIFRWNWDTSTYDFIRESAFHPTTTGDQTLTLDTPLLCEMGDIAGIYIPTANTIRTDGTVYSVSSRYASGDITSSNVFTTAVTYQYFFEVFGFRPYVTISGGSTLMGANGGTNNNWYGAQFNGTLGTNAKAIPGGNPLSEIMAQVKVRIPLLQYQNHALSTNTYAWGLSTGVPASLAVHPKYVIVGFGLNDIDQNRTWSQVESDLNAIKALFDASISENLLISEIQPRTYFDDAKSAIVRAWNVNLADWCTANDATLIICHDALGQIRPSTGEIDDLLSAYNQDQTHLTHAGVDKYAEIIANYIGR